MPQFGLDARFQLAYDGREKCIEVLDPHETEPGPHERPPHVASPPAL